MSEHAEQAARVPPKTANFHEGSFAPFRRHLKDEETDENHYITLFTPPLIHQTLSAGERPEGKTA
jgi:hypothetical protein